MIEDPFEVSNVFNSYFSSVSMPDSSFQRHYPKGTNCRVALTSMALTSVSEEEVARIVQRLNPKKSCDINGVSVWLLRKCFKHILRPITRLINFSFESGTFPSLLKVAKVTPIFKKDDPYQTGNYRPISILPVISKIFEKAFLERLQNFLECFDVLCPSQFGFRKNRSTIDAVTNLLESVVDGLERREHVLSIFLDLSKAFDCVLHDMLLHQLEASGIRGLPHAWISSYLRDREQCVQISSVLSNRVKMPLGVPQGSILGPVLFLLYVNKLNSSIQNGKIVQYADDTTLCVKSFTKENLEIKSFIALNSCIQNFYEINLKTNNSKSNVIHFCLRQQESQFLPAVMVDDVILEDTDSTKFLGMYLDRSLSWSDHVDVLCSKVASGIYALRNLAGFCSVQVLRMAYFGLIYPHIAYGIRLWGSCAKYNLERVFRLQKKAVRIISKLKPRESCRNAFRELGMLTLPCLYVFEVILYCNSKCTLVQGRDIHQYDTRSRDIFRAQRHRTIAFGRLPSQVGVRLINSLPEGIKNLKDSSQFKSNLKRLLVYEAFYSVDEFTANRWDNYFINF